MQVNRYGSHAIALLTAGAAAVLLWAAAPPVSFSADDWVMLSYPDRYDAAHSIYYGTTNFRRPTQWLVWTLFHRAFGIDRSALLAVSLVTHAAGSGFFAFAVARAYPRLGPAANIAGIVAFAIPYSGVLVLFATSEGQRWAVMLLWASCLVLQEWVRKGGWWRMILGYILFAASVFSYEVTAAMLPISVWLAWRCAGSSPFDRRSMARRLALSGIVCYALVYVIYRFAVGGVYYEANPLGPLEVLTNQWHLWTAPWRLVAWPSRIVPMEAAVAVVLGAGAWWAARNGDATPRAQEVGEALVVALAITVLGSLPFSIRGDVVDNVTMDMGSRWMVPACQGVALAVGVALQRFAPAIVSGAAVAAYVLVSLQNVRPVLNESAARLATDCALFASLLEQVPAVAPHSIFVLLGMSAGRHGHGWDGTGIAEHALRILYRNVRMQVYSVYSLAAPRHWHVAMEHGLQRPNWSHRPAPPDALVIVERRNDRFVLRDKVTADERQWQLHWEGREELTTNFERVLGNDETSTTDKLRRLGYRCVP